MERNIETKKDTHSFSIVVIFILFLFIGVFLIPKLSVQLLPSQTYASLTITSTLSDASTEITELELTSPLEAALSRLRGMKSISSISNNGRSQISIQLDKWTNPNFFRFEVSSLIRQLYSKLPENTSYPQIYLNKPEDDKRNQPILSYTLSGRGSANEIAKFAENELKPLLSELKGIHRFEISGARSEYVAITPDEIKMAALGIGITNLEEQLKEGFRNKELGSMTLEKGKIVVFLDKSLKSVNELLDYPVKNIGGRHFKLRDIASVAQSISKPSSIFRINGDYQVALLFYPEENVNSIELVNRIKHKLNHWDKDQNDYLLQLQTDQTEYIKDELSKIYVRTALSVAILLFFVILITRKLRYIIIILVSLIANILLSVICYYLFKLDIHLYSLAGITISLGLVIDNVIVIVEDIRTTGRNRIFAAILASTLTALGALSVIFLLEEHQKMQLIDFALAVIINLLVSLPIAYFFIPALLDLFPITIAQNDFLNKRKRRLIKFNKLYEKQLVILIKNKRVLIVFFILCLGIPLHLLPQKFEKETNVWEKFYNNSLGSDFYKKNLREPLNNLFGGVFYLYISNIDNSIVSQSDVEEETQLIVNLNMPTGAQLAQMDVVCAEFENILKNFKSEIDVFTTNILDPTNANIRILFKDGINPQIPFRIKNQLETKSIFSGSADFVITGIGKGFSNAMNVDRFESAISLKGYNYQQLYSLAMIVRDSLLNYKRVNDVLVSSQKESKEKSEYEHIIRFSKPEYLALNNIGKWSMGNALNRIAERTSSVGILDEETGKYPIPVQIKFNYENEPNIWMTKYAPLKVNDSTFIKFSGMTDISKVKMGKQMIRENQEYVLFVNYRFIGSYALNKIMNEKIVGSISQMLPFGYKLESTTIKGWRDDQINYLWFIPIVLIIIYMIASILLESLRQPIAIIAMIPFSFIGVFFTFHLLGLKFDQGGYTALLMLSGLVTNAALYIMNDLNFIVRDSTVNIKFFVRAFNLKAMPILVTTCSAILSLLPFMISGEEKGFWFTLSAGTIGGLLFSLIGAYLLLPVLMIPNNK